MWYTKDFAVRWRNFQKGRLSKRWRQNKTNGGLNPSSYYEFCKDLLIHKNFYCFAFVVFTHFLSLKVKIHLTILKLQSDESNTQVFQQAWANHTHWPSIDTLNDSNVHIFFSLIKSLTARSFVVKSDFNHELLFPDLR